MNSTRAAARNERPKGIGLFLKRRGITLLIPLLVTFYIVSGAFYVCFLQTQEDQRRMERMTIMTMMTSSRDDDDDDNADDDDDEYASGEPVVATTKSIDMAPFSKRTMGQKSWLSSQQQETKKKNSLRRRLPLQQSSSPPFTPGALIHVGKTGGSTIAKQLLNGCHSYVPKPCPNKELTTATAEEEESWISKLTTYYHVPDFKLLGKYRHYEFYVWTIRDPFERSLSAFTYMHPDNVLARKDDTPNWKRLHKEYKPLGECFDSLESFVTAIGSEPLQYEYPFESNASPDTTDCVRLARAIMDNKVKSAKHFYYDLKKLQKMLPSSATTTAPASTILVLRTEFLADDWKSANRWLGQPENQIYAASASAFPTNILHKKERDQTTYHTPVTKDISERGRNFLCHALREEYQVYLELLAGAANLRPDEKQNSLEMGQRNCPMLHLTWNI